MQNLYIFYNVKFWFCFACPADFSSFPKIGGGGGGWGPGRSAADRFKRIAFKRHASGFLTTGDCFQ